MMNAVLDGRAITAVETGYVLRLHIDGGMEVDIETAFKFRTQDGAVHAEPAGLCTESLQELVGQTVVTATVDNRGALSVRLTGGYEVEVPPNGVFEAWSILGPGGYKVVCMPGGALAEWAATD
jgi:hypothetical protein